MLRNTADSKPIKMTLSDFADETARNRRQWWFDLCIYRFIGRFTGNNGG